MVRTILGIDPGTLSFGYSIVRQEDAKYTLLEKTIFQLNKIDDQIEKNKRIYNLLTELKSTYNFDEIAIEQPVFGKDPQSMLKLGRVLGCCIGFAIANNIPICEYSPKNIKKTITGNGNASKQQVAFMVCNILNEPYSMQSKYDDTDAAAIAMCHAYNVSGTPVMSTKKSWDKFLKDNPDRIIS